MSDLTLSIIIVNWNTRDLLAQCIESIYANPPDASFDIWVVDNASSDGSAEMVRQRFPQVHLIENSENVGFARANNQAIRQSSGRYVLLLNSDTIVHKAALAELIAFVDQHPRTGICGALAFNADGSLQAGGNPFPTLVSELRSLLRVPVTCSIPSPDSAPVRTDWVGGACLLARRSTIKSIGPLDEHFFMYCEEVEWCWRVRKAGWDVYVVPRAHYTHWGGASTRQVRRAMRKELIRSKCRLLYRLRGRHQSQVYCVLARVIQTLGDLRCKMWRSSS